VIFLDTGFLFALVYADDVHHARVREVLEKHRDRSLADFVVTTNHVVAETVTLLRKRAGHDPQARHEDYSFVDCLSFVIMDRFGIREALAVDGDFAHRFVALPGPLPR
jgi:predicted nucleic acid-binding protein